MTAKTITRYEQNPVLAPDDVPYESSLAFNAGVTKFNGRYVMVFRNDFGLNQGEVKNGPWDFKTNFGLAFSDDGLKWEVQDKPCFSLTTEYIRCASDPRISVVDGRCYLCFSILSEYGIRGGIAVTDDFEDFEILSMSLPDNRNMVLFPEKVDGKFVRLERPFPVYGRGAPEAFDMWCSDSPDCKYWGNHKLVLGSDMVPYSNNKIGPAAPPVKTDAGWLTTFHAVNLDESVELPAWHKNWYKTYHSGIMLLDLDDPSKVLGMYDKPLLSPEQGIEYETHGYRGSVIFPGGMILEDDGEVKIYYGAADTVEALATAHVDDLINLCTMKPNKLDPNY